MMKYILTLCLTLVGFFTISAQIDIIDARNVSDGTIVTIEGIILNGSEGGQLRYIQDETGGIALFDGLAGSVSVQSLEAGDRVIIEGEKDVYQGLVELNKIFSVDYISPNNPLPEPKTIDLADLGTSFQSELVKVKCVSINSSFTFFSEGDYQISNKANTIQQTLSVFESSNVVGSSIPDNSVELIGISSFENSGILIVTESENIEEKECLGFLEFPMSTSIENNEVIFNWNMTESADHIVRFGESSESLSEVMSYTGISNVEHSFNGLEAGSIYFMEIESTNGIDIVNSGVIAFATKSNSSGEIEVYFNNDLDESFSDGSIANGTTASEFDSRLFQLFDNATETIDIAMYNINRTIIVNYLIDAFNRGVRIRYIADDETSNSAFNNTNPPFGVVFGNDGSPLMHNKFVVIDAEIEDQAKIIMGSTNFTSNQMSTDPNHMLVIHDQALARNYTIEFEEMWGSDSEMPDVTSSRFGENKEDNTCHIFNVNGVLIESFFSPSDGVTAIIEKSIRTADQSIDIGLLTLTKNELGQAIKDQKESGIDIRIILENFDDNGSEYYFLNDAGVPIKTHNFSPIYHHKLAIFDEGQEDAFVLTGSHNWTNKAEFQNDENTLLIHNQSIANIFRQEYEARWSQLPTSILEEKYQLAIYPNPVMDFLSILSENQIEEYWIYSLDGKLLKTGKFTDAPLIDVKDLLSGSYYIRVTIGTQTVQKLIIKH